MEVFVAGFKEFKECCLLTSQLCLFGTLLCLLSSLLLFIEESQKDLNFRFLGVCHPFADDMEEVLLKSERVD
jgi:hypothetical protein